MSYRRISNVLVIAFLVVFLSGITPVGDYTFRMFGLLTWPFELLVGGVTEYILIYRFDLDRKIDEMRE